MPPVFLFTQVPPPPPLSPPLSPPPPPPPPRSHSLPYSHSPTPFLFHHSRQRNFKDLLTYFFWPCPCVQAFCRLVPRGAGDPPGGQGVCLGPQWGRMGGGRPGRGGEGPARPPRPAPGPGGRGGGFFYPPPPAGNGCRVTPFSYNPPYTPPPPHTHTPNHV